MPVHVVYKGKVKWYRWGNHGKLYKSRAKAEAQGRAAYANGYKGKGEKK